MENRLYSIYHDTARADDVVNRLLAAGIGRQHISILTTETGGARHLALRKGTKAAEHGGIGATLGGAAGLVAGTLITAATAGVGTVWMRGPALFAAVAPAGE